MNSYMQYGDQSAPLMLFLHGGGVGGWMWERQVTYFSNYHCVVPELIRKGDVNFSIRDTAERMLELIDMFGKGKTVIVIGFSLGAQVLVQMLSMRPKVADYSIINSALVRQVPFSALLLKSMKWTMPLVKNRAFAKIQAKSLYINGSDFERYYQYSSQMPWEVFSDVMQENMEFRTPENFNKALGKILITVGSNEKQIMKRSMYDLVRANGNSQGCILPDVGHGAPLGKPELFNQLVELWVTAGKLPDCLQSIYNR